MIAVIQVLDVQLALVIEAAGAFPLLPPSPSHVCMGFTKSKLNQR